MSEYRLEISAFEGVASVSAKISDRRGRPPPTIFAHLYPSECHTTLSLTVQYSHKETFHQVNCTFRQKMAIFLYFAVLSTLPNSNCFIAGTFRVKLPNVVTSHSLTLLLAVMTVIRASLAVKLY